ncbi:MAG: hypothetical protein RLZZ371_2675, partial [Pseudomonadota bacterium]
MKSTSRRLIVQAFTAIAGTALLLGAATSTMAQEVKKA